jgi:hypothetical protein
VKVLIGEVWLVLGCGEGDLAVETTVESLSLPLPTP